MGQSLSSHPEALLNCICACIGVYILQIGMPKYCAWLTVGVNSDISRPDLDILYIIHLCNITICYSEFAPPYFNTKYFFVVDL